jgi:hypothetical protein
MSATKHTPGPWQTFGRQKTTIIADTPNTPMVAKTALGELGLKTCEANAEFIVRACNAHEDLLEVARLDQERSDLLDELSTCRDGLRRKAIEDRLDVVVDEKAVRRRAAIAKAEGRS